MFLSRPRLLALSLLSLGAAGCHKLTCPDGAILIPAGTFEMGTKAEVHFNWQLDPRQVTLTKPYCMDRTEVTHQAFAACQAAGGCEPYEGLLANVPDGWEKRPKDYAKLKEAIAFCKWRGGRLPTEAEWEFAARGTDGRLYPWGNEPPTPEHWQHRARRGDFTTAEVGAHPKGRSFFGLEDMSGNLSEWVADACGLHDTAPDIDPQGPDERWDRDQCHLLRGAAYSSMLESNAAATFRVYATFGAGPDSGFRCAYWPQ